VEVKIIMTFGERTSGSTGNEINGVAYNVREDKSNDLGRISDFGEAAGLDFRQLLPDAVELPDARPRVLQLQAKLALVGAAQGLLREGEEGRTPARYKDDEGVALVEALGKGDDLLRVGDRGLVRQVARCTLQVLDLLRPFEHLELLQLDLGHLVEVLEFGRRRLAVGQSGHRHYTLNQPAAEDLLHGVSHTRDRLPETYQVHVLRYRVPVPLDHQGVFVLQLHLTLDQDPRQHRRHRLVEHPQDVRPCATHHLRRCSIFKGLPWPRSPSLTRSFLDTPDIKFRPPCSQPTLGYVHSLIHLLLLSE
jgi:hypothetical protein